MPDVPPSPALSSENVNLSWAFKAGSHRQASPISPAARGASLSPPPKKKVLALRSELMGWQGLATGDTPRTFFKIISPRECEGTVAPPLRVETAGCSAGKAAIKWQPDNESSRVTQLPDGTCLPRGSFLGGRLAGSSGGWAPSPEQAGEPQMS